MPSLKTYIEGIRSFLVRKNPDVDIFLPKKWDGITLGARILYALKNSDFSNMVFKNDSKYAHGKTLHSMFMKTPNLLAHANLSGAVFDGVNMAGIILTRAIMMGAIIRNTNLLDARNSYMVEAHFNKAHMDFARFDESKLRYVDMSDPSMNWAIMDDSMSDYIYISGTSLKNASWQRLRIREVAESNLSVVSLRTKPHIRCCRNVPNLLSCGRLNS